MLGFRVWDIKEKIFLTSMSDYIEIISNMSGELGKIEKLGIPGFQITTLESNTHIPMQSTGLYDNNFKLIYVGDIVEYKVESGKNLETRRLVIDKLPYGIADLYSFDNEIIDRWFTIVGNVFETPGYEQYQVT